jgi:hypothetical protein
MRDERTVTESYISMSHSPFHVRERVQLSRIITVTFTVTVPTLFNVVFVFVWLVGWRDLVLCFVCAVIRGGGCMINNNYNMVY